MSSDELQKIQDDLTTMRQAIKHDKTYAAADILPVIVLGLGALLCIPMLQYRLFWNPRVCLLVALSPGIVLYLRRYQQAQKDQADRPVLWKEYKWSMVAVFVLTPAAVAWLWWNQQFGTSREAAGAAVIFCMGLAATLIGALDSSRQSYLPAGVCVIVFAFLVPTLEPRQIPIAGCILLAVLSFTVSTYIWWQTRDERSNADTGETTA